MKKVVLLNEMHSSSYFIIGICIIGLIFLAIIAIKGSIDKKIRDDST